MRTAALLAVAAFLSACGPAETAPVVPADAVRVPLARAAVPEAAAIDPRRTTVLAANSAGAWAYDPKRDTALFGEPGRQALVAVACVGRAEGSPRIVVTRYFPAERGAEAILAIQSTKRILRLPVHAVALRRRESAWRGGIDASDERAQVFVDGSQIAATLPGGGRLTLPPLGAAAAGIEACRASPEAAPALIVAPAPAHSGAQTLPNAASNPAMSPAAR
ncbi:MAG TPA: hypothetical protein VM055_02555 [Novosphingobium sp.]|nr:hypothetical protein [Novosphingobium sp.]